MSAICLNRRNFARFALLAAAGTLVGPRVAGAQSADQQSRLYLATPDSRSLRPVDPVDLSVDGDPAHAFDAPVPLTPAGKRGFSGWIASANGGTVVRFAVDPTPSTSAPYGTAELTTIDAATGAVTSSFVAPAWSQQVPQISADGRRIVIEAGAMLATDIDGALSIGDYPSWYAFDTATGAQIAQIRGDGEALAGLQRLGLLDPAGDKLYRLVARGRQLTVGPWPTELVIHDLPSGAELARLDLPEVNSGFWAVVPATPTTGRAPVAPQCYATPSMIVARDRRSLLALDADGSHATEIDLDALAVKRRMATGLAPIRAWRVEEARETGCTLRYPLCLASAGPEIHVLAMPDDRHLLVGGYAIEFAGDDARTVSDYGVQLVDLDAGRVVATADAGPETTLAVLFEQKRFWTARDGHAYYAIGARGAVSTGGTPVAGGDSGRIVLYRIAADDLRITAERDVTDDGSTYLVVLASPLPASAP